MAKMSELSDKDFKAVIVKMLHEKLNTFEANTKLKRLSERIEDIKRNQMKIIQLKNIVIEMKSSGNGLNI